VEVGGGHQAHGGAGDVERLHEVARDHARGGAMEEADEEDERRERPHHPAPRGWGRHGVLAYRLPARAHDAGGLIAMGGGVAYYVRASTSAVFSRRDSVEFGISLPGRGPLAKPDQVLAMAARADALGYASIFVTDHVVLPTSMARSVYPYSATRQLPGGAAQDYLEPLALLGALARETKRARLGTSVLVIPYRHPLVTAKILATLDRLSGGRLILGAGVGWLREEFEAVGAPPFEERGAVTDEYLAFMRQTWTTDPVSFRGRYVRVDNVHALPKPAQPAGIPVWIGGHTDGAVRRAARLGDGWHPLIMRPPGLLLPDEYAARVRQLKAWAKEAG